MYLYILPYALDFWWPHWNRPIFITRHSSCTSHMEEYLDTFQKPPNITTIPCNRSKVPIPTPRNHSGIIWFLQNPCYQRFWGRRSEESRGVDEKKLYEVGTLSQLEIVPLWFVCFRFLCRFFKDANQYTSRSPKKLQLHQDLPIDEACLGAKWKRGMEDHRDDVLGRAQGRKSKSEGFERAQTVWLSFRTGSDRMIPGKVGKVTIMWSDKGSCDYSHHYKFHGGGRMPKRSRSFQSSSSSDVKVSPGNACLRGEGWTVDGLQVFFFVDFVSGYLCTGCKGVEKTSNPI